MFMCLRMLLAISLWCVYFCILVCYNDKFGIFIPSFVAIGLTVAELERHKTNMNAKEKHIIQSILKRLYQHQLKNCPTHIRAM